MVAGGLLCFSAAVAAAAFVLRRLIERAWPSWGQLTAEEFERIDTALRADERERP